MSNFEKQFDTQIRRYEDRLGVSLDPNFYETYRERHFEARDLLTTASAVSVAGLALVIDGCRDLTKINNIHKIAAGRAMDLFDGSIARFMKQESDAGALVDAGCDKLAMLTIARSGWQQNALPKPFIAYVGATNTLHFGLTARAALNHPDVGFRPPVSAKISMAATNLAGGAYLYANAYEHQKPEEEKHTPLRRRGHLALLGGIAAETKALPEYFKRAR